MTQEQKAQAYDEALGWMREMYPCLTDSLREDAEHYFPELAESEDERIRKELKEAFEAYDIESTWNGIPIRSILAWLEKQKESLHIPETCKENANSFTDGIIEVRSFQRGMEEGRKLEKQKEQKPVECIEFDNEFEKQVSHLLASVLNGEWEYNEGFVKHAAQSLLGYAKNEMKQTKPNHCLYGGDPSVGRCRWCYAACSARLTDSHTDEEKEYIRTIKSIISDFIRDKKPENLAYYQRIYDWLDGRHVPFSCGHENGAKWSKEDEKDIAHIIRILDDCYAYGKHDLSKTDHENLVNKLKSLRPSWKPSEEQMSYLLSLHQGGEEQKPLRELIEQLKKLM